MVVGSSTVGWTFGRLAVVSTGFVAILVAVLGFAVSDAWAGKSVDRVVAGETTAGTTEGRFNAPRGLAVNYSLVADGSTDPTGDSTNGYVYVADASNHRIQAYSPDGTFRFMFGRGVQTGANAPEVCDRTEVPCQGASSFTGVQGGMFNQPTGVAIDQTTGHLFVRDRLNGRVQEFEANGTFVKAWGWGVATGIAAFEVCTVQATCLAGRRDQAEGNGNGGQLPPNTGAGNAPGTGIAVIPAGPVGSPNPNAGNVVVADQLNRRVQEFDPSSVGTAVFVRLWGWDVVTTGQTGDIGPDNFEICASTTIGVCKTAADQGLANTRPVGRFANDRPLHLAAAPGGTVYAMNVGFSNRPRVDSFDSSLSTPAALPLGGCVVSDAVGGSTTVASEAIDVVPATGNLLVVRNDESVRVAELANASGACTLADSHYVNSGLAGSGLALNPDSGDLFMATPSGGGGGHRLFAADDDGAPPAVMSIQPPSGVGSRTATLNGVINPDGVFGAAWRLEVSRNGTSWTTVSSGNVAGGNSDTGVSGQATGLRPNTLYRVRLVSAKEFGNPEVASAELTFATDAEAPEIAAVAADGVGASSARLSGRLNAHSTSTSYRFEWGQGNFNNSVPVPNGPVGSGPEFVFVSQQLSGLSPETTYQFRLVATSVSEGTTVGAAHTFTTLASDAVVGARGLEMVSPADKAGAVGLGWWYNDPGATATSGTAAHRGERFVAKSHFGGTLLEDGSFAYADDIALCEREGDSTGWGCHPGVTNPAYGTQIFRGVAPRRAASEDLALMGWETNGGLLRPFPEMAGWDAQQVNNPLFVGDWSGRWEIFGPNSPTPWQATPDFPQQVVVNTDSEPGGGEKAVAFAADGGFVVSSANIRGMGGLGDPSIDMVARPARSTYLMDFTGGVSNSFPGTGVRSLVHTCSADTVLAARTEVSPGVFAIDGQPCPAPDPGRDAALVSSRGATIQAAGGEGTVKVNPTAKIISRDGSRVFFMSPDPQTAGVPTAGCTGAGAASVCPSQLFVRQRNGDGSVVTRWLSKPVDSLLGVQAASLAGQAIFEGASDDGSRVFFRSNAPLTADDPNAGCGAPCLAGSPSANSWDLYMYELAPGDDPTGPGGELTRISRGPTGSGDCNSPVGATGTVGALRFVSADGETVYFTCAAPLPDAEVPSDSTRTTTPSGTVTTTTDSNLYRYTDTEGSATWRFIARLARGTGSVPAACATTGIDVTSAIGNSLGGGNANNVGFTDGKCVHGTDDGEFVTFWTPSALTTDDPEAGSMDIYTYDAASDELVRITGSQGGVGTGYTCGLTGAATQTLCHGDPGYESSGPLALLGVATDPAVAGDRVAFFQSKARLIAGDTDDAYDVYQWRNGVLSLLSTGKSTSDGAFYKGNDRTGQNVYLVTRDQMTWQDHDALVDAYTARTNGGIPQPPAPPACNTLAHQCQGGEAQLVIPAPSATHLAGGGDVSSGGRSRLAVVGVRGRRALAVRVRASGVGRLSVAVSGRVGGRSRRVGSETVRVGRPGVVSVRVRLSRGALSQLRARGVLRLSVRASMAGARDGSRAVVLRGAGR
jgi:hypothetical protein